MTNTLRFAVHGKPQPGGSKRGFVVNGRAVLSDANAKAKPWRAAVSEVAAEAMQGRALLTGAVRVAFTFYRPRPASHYGSGKNADKLKASAPAYWTTKPDALKLARVCEDAMSGIVYRDDAQIVDEWLGKRWGEPARVEIEVEALP